jgi:succinate-semialdehyde dehydrogenase
MLTKAVDVVIATGGMDMVRAVYSSGKPALGVGSGNVQVLFDRGVDYARAVPMVIAGRAFDNGIICTGEQSASVPDEDFAKVMQIFADNQAYVAPETQRDALRAAVFPGGKMNRELIGQTAAKVAQAAGLSVPEGTKILIVEAAGRDDILGSEKMFPLVAAYRYGAWEEAVAIARANLEKIGKGHSICIHSNNREHVEYAATHIEVSRVLVNQICATSGGGSFQNGLNPTSTLGCGSWGNNSISENLTYYHLLNISRIAYPLPDNKIPTDAEIWG